MPKTTVEISSKWVAIINSPLMWVMWTLQGVSVSFAPLFLYWSGKGSFFPEARWITVPVCFAIIYFEGVFFFGLGNLVIRQVREPKDNW